MILKKGLYESAISKALKNQLELHHGLTIDKEDIDQAVASQILATYLSSILEKGFDYYRSGPEDLFQQIEIANRIIASFAEQIGDGEFLDYVIDEEELLRGIYDPNVEMKEVDRIRPLTSVARSSLFTGTKTEPSVYSELIKEIATADRVDLLVSFIKYSGLRLLLPALTEHTTTKHLRVLTTSYMGATDYKAIQELACLPNTEIRISYDTKRTRLHAKAYYFHRATGFSTAYIGSSNLSRAALTEGLEWNLKISEHTSRDVMEKYRATFETYWNSSDFVFFDPNSLEDQRQLEESLKQKEESIHYIPQFNIRPYNYQQQILDLLEVERRVHNSRRNLVVAATGTGKTVISAFDFKRYYERHPGCRLLFLAHRKEILQQSIATFRSILKDYNFGDLWVGEHSPRSYQHLFASIQTLNSGNKYTMFEQDYFDYIVLDETHHVSADSYDRILEYFLPDILLGLTATPERMDGQDITTYFNGRIASEMRLHEAIERKLLCPFHYFGVSDNVDLDSIQWVKGNYDVSQLSNVYTGNDARADLIARAVDKYATDLSLVRGLGFCVSKEHAAFMSKAFNRRNLPSMHLDADSSLQERNTARRRLVLGEIKFIFVVDLYNEGVDIPQVNTVLFLRPTQSATVFIQQLGRGLRLHDDKDVLTVLDFVGRANKEYSFGNKYRSILGKTNHSVAEELVKGFPSLPKGCFVQLEPKAEEYVLANLRQTTTSHRRLVTMVQNFTNESTKPLTLANFLNHYLLEPWQIYRNWSFHQICHAAGKLESYQVDDQVDLRSTLGRVMHINSYKWLEFLLEYLKRPEYSLEGLSPEDESMLLMFHYTVWDRDAEGDVLKYLYRLRDTNPGMFLEILELLQYNRDRIDFLEQDIDLGYPHPLELYARYSSTQVLAACGYHTADTKKTFREGVLYLEEKDTDIFFVTLDKSDKSFSDSTQYEDYAINEWLFHWQSQSRTSDTSPTGQRYISQRKNKSTVLLFVRERKREGSITEPFYFLGKANYVSHSGSKPISIIWEMERPIPAFILQKSNKLIS